jgi:hypothetical protein
MIINTKYDINSKIYIKDLKIHGKIIGISYYNRLKYDVRFFNGFDPKECLFLEEELSLQEDEAVLGFKAEKS